MADYIRVIVQQVGCSERRGMTDDCEGIRCRYLGEI